MDGSKVVMAAPGVLGHLNQHFNEDFADLSRYLMHYTPNFIRTPFEATIMILSKDRNSFVLSSPNGKIAICSRFSREILQERQHSGLCFTSLALSHSASTLLAGDANGTLHEINLEDLSLINTFKIAKSALTHLIVLDSQKALVATSNGKVFSVDYENKRKEVLLALKKQLNALDHYDGSIVAGTETGEVVILSLEAAKLKDIKLKSAVSVLKLTPTYLIVAHGNVISIFHSATWKKQFTLSGHSGKITALELHGDVLISGSSDCTLKVWTVNEWHDPMTLYGHDAEVKAIIIHDRIVHSLGANKYIRVSRIPSLLNIKNYRTGKTIKNFLFNPKSSEVYALNEANELFEVNSKVILSTYASPIIGWSFTQDYGSLVVFYPKGEGHTSIHAEFLYVKSEKNATCVELRTSSLPTVCVATLDLKFLITGEMFRITVWDCFGNQQYIFRSHISNITAMVVKDNNLLAADATGVVKCYDLLNFEETATFNEPDQQSVSLIQVSKDFKILFTVTEFNTVKLWSVKRGSAVHQMQYDERVQDICFSSDSLYFFITFAKRIEVWNIKSFSKTFVHTFQDSVNTLVFDHSQKKMICSFKGYYKVMDNPLNSKSLSIYGKTEEIHKFVEYITKIFSGVVPKYSERMNNFVIEPLHINILHIYAYFNLSKHLGNAIAGGASFFPSSAGYTPLEICLDKSFGDCVHSLLNNFIQELQKNPVSFYYFGNSMAKLNSFSPDNLQQIYDLAFKKSLDSNMPLFCHESADLPIIKESAKLFLAPENFLPLEKYSYEDKAIEFTQSYFKINVINGSSESLAFIKGLVECKNLDVFSTKFIRTLIDQKWTRLRWVHYADFVLYFIYLLSLCFGAFSHSRHWVFIVGFVINQVLFIYEIFQMVSATNLYFSSLVNYLDITRSILFNLYCAVEYFDFHESSQGTLLLITMLLSLLRGFGYFRVFSSTRWLIYLILEIMYQLWAFIFVTLYTIVSLGIIYQTIMNEYTTTIDKDFQLEWLLLFFIIVVNPLIILNLFISIVGNALEKIKDERNVKDRQELTEMIFEAEILLFWRRNRVSRKFVHLCDEEHANVMLLNSVSERIRYTAEKSEKLLRMFQDNSQEVQALKNTMFKRLKKMEQQVELVAKEVNE